MQLGGPGEPCRYNALSPNPCRRPLRSDLRLLRLQGQVSWASTSLFNYSYAFDGTASLCSVAMHARQEQRARPSFAVACCAIAACGRCSPKDVVMESPAMAFLKGCAEHIYASRWSDTRPDGSGSTIMLLLSAHLAARQEIAHKAFARGNSWRSTSPNSSATHGHNGGRAVVAQAVHHEHMRQS